MDQQDENNTCLHQKGQKGGGGHKINTKPSFDLDDSDYRL
jgi:hypothetical protein